MLSYADSLSMARGGQIAGEPFELVKKVLVKQPDNITALWLAGLGYSEAGDYEKAIRLWQKLEPLLQSDQNSLVEVRSLIAQAEQALGHSVENSEQVASSVDSPVTQAVSITLNISLSEAFRQQVKPDDIVFIYAKAHQGPPMPLAVVRKTAASLPLTVTLDDGMAMMPQMRLSSFDLVDVGARISKSGAPVAQPGDLQGVVESVDLSKITKIDILINEYR
jgi:cytochrome c-type biogenesis protein CcmH